MSETKVPCPVCGCKSIICINEEGEAVYDCGFRRYDGQDDSRTNACGKAHRIAIERARLLREAVEAGEPLTKHLEEFGHTDLDLQQLEAWDALKAKIEAHLGGEEKGDADGSNWEDPEDYCDADD